MFKVSVHGSDVYGDNVLWHECRVGWRGIVGVSVRYLVEVRTGIEC